MKVECGLRIYEVNDTETDAPAIQFSIESHWNRREFVVLIVGKEKVTVLASELKAAIENCTNTGKF